MMKLIALKTIEWIGKSRKSIKAFPDEARNLAGYQLMLVQLGRSPDDWRAMPTVGLGVIEIRIHKPHEHRVMYVCKFPEAIYVLHAFEKKTQKTSNKDLNTAQTAYLKMQQIRSEKQKNAEKGSSGRA